MPAMVNISLITLEKADYFERVLIYLDVADPEFGGFRAKMVNNQADPNDRAAVRNGEGDLDAVGSWPMFAAGS